MSTVDEAGDDALTFAISNAYLTAALSSAAAAILVEESLSGATGKPLRKDTSGKISTVQ